MRWSSGRTRAVVIAATVLATSISSLDSPALAAPWNQLMVARPITLADTADLWDIGVTDINGDGVPDIYSTNHNARQDVMLGDGAFGFTDVVTSLGLDQDRAWPGAEIAGPPADLTAAGLYLWREGNDHISVHATVDANTPTVDATVSFYGTVSTVQDPGVNVVITPGTDSDGRPINLVHVTSSVSGTASVNVDLVGTPMHVDVAAPTALAAISVGPGELHPTSTSFDWRLQDRHGIAWADLDGDGDLDAFVVRGGLKGYAAGLDNLVSDELFRNDEGHLVDVTASSGIVKNGCRGRRATWVDYDADGDLDLEVTCEGAAPQLWRRDGVWTFTDMSRLLPPDADVDTFIWLDVTNDGRPELLTTQADGIGVYKASTSGRFTLRDHYASAAAPFSDVAFTDRDGDGAPDVLFVSPRGTVLLSGRPGGSFRVEDPAKYGLPTRAWRIAFTDVNRDGLVDLFAMPGGVYRQTATHSFLATPLFANLLPRGTTTMGSVWFDVDGDGDPDALIGYATNGSKDWNVAMYENRSAPAHWLALDLVGRVGNREAIGAKVTVVAGGVTSYHWVGEAETARESQGQYGIDVSLGATTTKVDSITVTWPDRSTTTLTNVAADHTVQISQTG